VNEIGETCDVLVIGAGAAGLSAAISARLSGAKVIVAEKAEVFGGTTALSGGWCWIPLSHHAKAAGVDDSEDEVLTYLRHEVGSALDEAKVRAFLQAGPEMLELYQNRTILRFELGTAFPDYHPEAPGAKLGGRALSSPALDARDLGSLLPKLAPPLRALMLAGISIGSGTELRHFFRAKRSPRSALFVLRRLLSHGWDVLRFGRSMRLVNGNALAARLGKSATDLGAAIWLSSPVTQLLMHQECVVGAIFLRQGIPCRVQARKGVILAMGGFPHNPARRSALYAHAASEQEHLPLAPQGNSGDGLRLALSIGAAVGTGLPQNAAWAPVSQGHWPSGMPVTYPHFVDRGKPGIIAVAGPGRRFVNEASSYHDFVAKWIDLREGNKLPTAWLIADAHAFGRYGLGLARPFPFPHRHWLRSGYLLRAKTLPELAAKAELDGTTLAETIRRFNQGAAHGHDPDFGRGSSAYNRFQGDIDHRPNPSLAPLDRPPFYAVRIRPGDIGTFEGILTDAHARVLNDRAQTIPGLYAAGNDMRSLMGGYYPGAGITLGPALVFGFIAGRDAAKRNVTE
jgi:succinate dehydrogenase/fumarate reductase flavoprotein subunit